MAVPSWLFVDVYWVNAILFIAIGIIELIYRGYNSLNLSQSYDWSHRIWILFCVLMLSFGNILYEGPCSKSVKRATFVVDLTFWIIIVPLQSHHDYKNLIQMGYIIGLSYCVVGVGNDILKLF